MLLRLETCSIRPLFLRPPPRAFVVSQRRIAAASRSSVACTKPRRLVALSMSAAGRCRARSHWPPRRRLIRCHPNSPDAAPPRAWKYTRPPCHGQHASPAHTTESDRGPPNPSASDPNSTGRPSTRKPRTRSTLEGSGRYFKQVYAAEFSATLPPMVQRLVGRGRSTNRREPPPR